MHKSKLFKHDFVPEERISSSSGNNFFAIIFRIIGQVRIFLDLSNSLVLIHFSTLYKDWRLRPKTGYAQEEANGKE